MDPKGMLVDIAYAIKQIRIGAGEPASDQRVRDCARRAQDALARVIEEIVGELALRGEEVHVG